MVDQLYVGWSTTDPKGGGKILRARMYYYLAKDEDKQRGVRAFKGCSGLTKVRIPGSVTEISSYAFKGCSGLTSGKIPDGVTEIGEFGFHGCSGLTSVTIPGSVTEITSYAFDGCSGLTSVTIPGSVTEIGEFGFHGCSGLTSVTIPDGVTEISSYALRAAVGSPKSGSYQDPAAPSNCSPRGPPAMGGALVHRVFNARRG